MSPVGKGSYLEPVVRERHVSVGRRIRDGGGLVMHDLRDKGVP